MTSNQNAALLNPWAELWSGNLAIADKLVTEDFPIHVASMLWMGGSEMRGRQALKAWISSGLASLFPDKRFSAEVGPIADENYLVVRWKVEGAYSGGFSGASPEAVGRMITLTGTDIVRIVDGKFAEYWLNVDSLYLLQQLGVREVPALAMG